MTLSPDGVNERGLAAHLLYHGPQYRVMTNDPTYDEQLRLLAKLDFSHPSSDMPLPGNVSALDRFQRASYFSALLPAPRDDRDAAAGVLAIARNVSVPFGAPYADFGVYNTEYRTVCDLTNRRYFLPWPGRCSMAISLDSRPPAADPRQGAKRSGMAVDRDSARIYTHLRLSTKPEVRMNRKTEETGARMRGHRRAAHARRWLGPPRLPSALSVLLLIVGCLASVVITSLVGVEAASAGTAPAPPAGWNTVFSDNFAGAAGTAPSAQNWFYDIGSGYGTGEIENTTNSTSNVYLDGNGDLTLKAIDNGGTWTSGRIESTRDDFEAPAGGELEMTASIEQPNPASGLGYWPAFWALGSPMRTGGGWPQSGELDMMEDVNGLNEASQTLHDSANSPGHALIACPTTGCQTGYNTYSVIINRTDTSAETLEYLMDGVVESTITEASVGTAAWQAAIDHGFFIIFDLAMGGNYPDGICDCTAPTSATTSGASMSVQYVAVYEEGGNSTPTGTATATGQVTGDGGLCLANQNALDTEGNPIIADSCDGDAGQQWSPYTDGTLRTQGGCLDVVAAGTTSGTDIDWYACNASPAQDWTHESNGELVNPNSGLCLTDPGGNPSAQLELEACADSAAQVWNLPSGTTTGNTITVSNPGNQTSTVGTAASLQVAATDSASGQTLTYGASGLPGGLSINSSTGLISGTPTTAGTSNVTVAATDTTGADGTASFTWTVSSSTGTGSGGVDISAGGPAAAPFVADEDYTGGATADTANAITTTGVTNPAPQSVYQHNRYGNFTYTIPGLTAGASYTVRLDFAEEYWTAAGDRTFNVLINGTQVLTNFDIFATAGGEYKAVAESFTATASSNGTVTIQFVSVKDNAQVNGIEISPA